MNLKELMTLDELSNKIAEVIKLSPNDQKTSFDDGILIALEEINQLLINK